MEWREQDQNQEDQLGGYCIQTRNNEGLVQNNDSADGEERMSVRNI